MTDPSSRNLTSDLLPSKPREWEMLIDGQWTDLGATDRLTRESPAHGVPVATYVEGSAATVDAAVSAARTAFDKGPWPTMTGRERATVLHRVADAIRAELESLAVLEVLESGKPITQCRDELATAADLWDYAASSARHLYGETYDNLGETHLGFVFREPIGVVGVITPWNFPFLIVSQKLPFVLAAGCTAVIKPSELTPGTTLQLGRILQEMDLPDGVVNVITGHGEPVGARLAGHDGVDMLSFTGSTGVGRQIVAASSGNLKKVSLELGGKNPNIVFDDADLEAAMDAVVFGAYFNMGECCNSGSRLLVQDSIADAFTAGVVRHASTVPVGDPLDDATKVGAIINDEQLAKISSYVSAGRQDGAELVLGGNQLATNGRFFEPTVFTHVQPDMSIAKEEIFGPVLSVIAFRDAQHVVEIANSTMYGLSAGVWTRDIDRALMTSRAIRAGTIWVNTFMDGHAELPFGGYNQSGLGRELGRQATEEFTQLKTVQVSLGPRTSWWHRPGNDTPKGGSQ